MGIGFVGCLRAYNPLSHYDRLRIFVFEEVNGCFLKVVYDSRFTSPTKDLLATPPVTPLKFNTSRVNKRVRGAMTVSNDDSSVDVTAARETHNGHTVKRGRHIMDTR
jgi:hypothetical protein